MERHTVILPYSKDDFEYIATNSETSSYVIVSDKNNRFKTCVYETKDKEEAYRLHLEFIRENYPHALCINNLKNKCVRVRVEIRKRGYVYIPIEHSCNADYAYWFVTGGEFLEHKDKLNITLKGLVPDDFKTDMLNINVKDIDEMDTEINGI